MPRWLTLLLGVVYVVIAISAICVSSPRVARWCRRLCGRVTGSAPPPAVRQLDETGVVPEWTQVGELGVTHTRLDPQGEAWFGPALVEVVSPESPVEAGAIVRIVETGGERIVVRAETESAAPARGPRQ